MSGNITFTMIARCSCRWHIGAILGKITEALDSTFKTLKLTQLTVADAKNSMKYMQKRP